MRSLYQDLKGYSEGSLLKAIATIFLNPNFKATRNYRIANFFYYKFGFKLLPKMIHYRNRVKYGIDIDYRAQIGGGLKILHGVGIVIGLNVKAGENFTIYQGVTCGGNSSKRRVLDGREITQPHFGNNTVCYANSTILGPVMIGDNCKIGAGAVILKDVSDGTTVYCRQKLVKKQDAVD